MNAIQIALLSFAGFLAYGGAWTGTAILATSLFDPPDWATGALIGLFWPLSLWPVLAMVAGRGSARFASDEEGTSI